jgi:lactam utilization protein B
VAVDDGHEAKGFEFETLCIHSDTPGAGAIARAVRRELEAAGFDVRVIDA